ncbi:hypothetical protein C8F04DRAFT_1203140 [Mycena alexandri]|uniref:Uncharacterized protein n=1 Tax=Mycena alexandri TaxID=1745969 RepID=A0AAD6RVP7_9AGAR|nr:hypothetical protein C8F04DRAFT_1203140 [Mycena alexandri]
MSVRRQVFSSRIDFNRTSHSLDLNKPSMSQSLLKEASTRSTLIQIMILHLFFSTPLQFIQPFNVQCYFIQLTYSKFRNPNSFNLRESLDLASGISDICSMSGFSLHFESRRLGHGIDEGSSIETSTGLNHGPSCAGKWFAVSKSKGLGFGHLWHLLQAKFFIALRVQESKEFTP